MIEGYLICKRINQQERQHMANIFQEIDEDKSGRIEICELKKFY
jgi:Ca2+-binding EF-hand superfamily protein